MFVFVCVCVTSAPLRHVCGCLALVTPSVVWRVMEGIGTNDTPRAMTQDPQGAHCHWWTKPLLTNYNERRELFFCLIILLFLPVCSSGALLLAARVCLCTPFYLVVFDYVLISGTTSYFIAASLGCQTSPQHMQLYLIMWLWIQYEALYTVDWYVWAGSHAQK